MIRLRNKGRYLTAWVAVAGVVLTSGFGATWASPSGQMNYLMGEPVSLLDFGIYKLELALDSIVNPSGTNVGVTVSYDWNGDQIKIQAFVEPSSHDGKDECRSAVNAIKTKLYIEPETGRPAFADHSRAALFFTHEGFKRNSEPKDFGAQIDSKIRIYARVLINKGGATQAIKCEAPLIGKDILFSGDSIQP